MRRVRLGPVTASVVAVWALSPTARAGTGQYSLIDGAGLEYLVNAEITAVTTSSASGALADGAFTGAVAATTEDGSTVMTKLNDMFDGGRSLFVSLTSKTGQPNASTAGVVVYGVNGPASVACGDREIVFPVQKVGDLEVSRRVYVPAEDAFARHLEVVKNTGSSPLTLTLGIGNNLGSDLRTRIDATSDGDTEVELSDTWIASFQSYSAKTSSDIRMGHVLKAEGQLGASLVVLTFVDGEDQPYWWWSLTLNPGETQIVASYVTGQASRAAARDKATELSGMDNAHMFDCLTSEARAQIVNFPVQCDAAGSAGAICNDFDRCTLDDVCVAGACTGTIKDCRSGASDCTGVCDSASGACVEDSVVDGTQCTDADVCNGNDTCQSGLCTSSGTPLDCADTDNCTADSCDALSGCARTPITGCGAADAGGGSKDAGSDAGSAGANSGGANNGTTTGDIAGSANDASTARERDGGMSAASATGSDGATGSTDDEPAGRAGSGGGGSSSCSTTRGTGRSGLGALSWLALGAAAMLRRRRR